MFNNYGDYYKIFTMRSLDNNNIKDLGDKIDTL